MYSWYMAGTLGWQNGHCSHKYSIDREHGQNCSSANGECAVAKWFSRTQFQWIGRRLDKLTLCTCHLFICLNKSPSNSNSNSNASTKATQKLPRNQLKIAHNQMDILCARQFMWRRLQLRLELGAGSWSWSWSSATRFKQSLVYWPTEAVDPQH